MKNEEPKPVNVAEAFLQAFSLYTPEHPRFGELAELETASPCGQTCLEAIEAGRKLESLILASLGEESEHLYSVPRMVEEACLVFWLG